MTKNWWLNIFLTWKCQSSREYSRLKTSSKSIKLISNFEKFKKFLYLHHHFSQYAKQQVNNKLTLRNWLIGFYIVEYEQKGKDRAKYGEKTLLNLSEKLTSKGLKWFSGRNLRLFRQFYLSYPEIWQNLSAKFEKDPKLLPDKIWQLPTAKLIKKEYSNINVVEIVIDSLSFTWFNPLLFEHF